MTVTVVKFGNSKGIIIPAKVLKSLDISERDSLEIHERSDGFTLKKKKGISAKRTPFSALDEWNEEQGIKDDFSLEESLQYAKSIREQRANKDIIGW